MIMALIRRGMCCFKTRTRRNSGSLLPVTVKGNEAVGANIPEYQRPLLSQYSQAQDAWSSQSWQQQQVAHFQQHSNLPASQSQQQQLEEPEEEDFFKDMTPKLKQQKKILLDVSGHASDSRGMSNKFTVDVTAAVIPSSHQLEDLHDSDNDGGAAWEEEVFDIDSTLKEVKEAERRRRQEQHQQRFTAASSSSAGKGKKSLAATRLS